MGYVQFAKFPQPLPCPLRRARVPQRPVYVQRGVIKVDGSFNEGEKNKVRVPECAAHSPRELRRHGLFHVVLYDAVLRHMAREEAEADRTEPEDIAEKVCEDLGV